MKVLDLAFNNFKFLSRDKKNLLFLILFPIIFMVIFGSVFGGDYFDDGTFAVGILSLDEGYNDYNLSSDFIQVLEDAEYDNSNNMFKITNVSDQATGEKLIENSTISGLIIIPEDFTESLITHQPVNLTVKGNPSSQEYGVFMALFCCLCQFQYWFQSLQRY